MIKRLILALAWIVLAPALGLSQTNNPPVITTTNNSFNVNENEFANFITQATDADGDQLTYTFTVTAGSVNLLFPGPIVRAQGQSVTNQFTVPPGTQGGPAIEVTVDVSDGTDSDLIVFTFNVTGVNTAPVVNILADQSGNSVGDSTNPFQPGGILLNADITDPDNEGGYGYLWGVSPGFTSCGNTNVFFQAEGPDPTLSIGRVSSTTNFTITLTILDGAHRIAHQRVVTVAPAAGGCQAGGNSPPIIQSADASPNAVAPGGIVTLTSIVTDPNPGDTLTFAWFVSSVASSKGTLFSTSRNTTYTAPGSPTVLFFTLEASDGVETVSRLDSVTVTPGGSGGGGGGGSGSPPPGADSTARSCSSCGGNLAPRVDAGPATWTSQGGQTITLEGFGEDPDSGLPPGQVAFGATWSVIDSGGLNLPLGSPTSLETTLDLPVVQAPVTVTLELRLVDFSFCACADTMDLTIAVQQAPNEPPVVVTSVDKPTAKSGEVVTLDGSQSSDPDADALLFFWNPDSSNSVSVDLNSENSDDSIVSFLAPSVTVSTEFKFNLTVSDQRGGAVTSQVTVTIEPNEPPEIREISEIPVVSGAVSLGASAGSIVGLSATAVDPEGESLSYGWSQTSGPMVEITGDDQADASFSAPAVVEEIFLEFLLTVSDGVSSSQATVTVSVVQVTTVLVPLSSFLTNNPHFDNRFVGGAIVNQTTQMNPILMSSLEQDGNKSSIDSPPFSVLPGGGQNTFLTRNVDSALDAVAVVLQGDLGVIRGFFILGNNNLTKQDGAGGEFYEGTRLFFPIARQGEDDATLLFLFNPAGLDGEELPLEGAEAIVTIDLMSTSGNVLLSTTKVIPPQGSISGDLNEIFETEVVIGNGYLRAQSQVAGQSQAGAESQAVDISGIAFYGNEVSFAAVSGQPGLEAADLGASLFSPHFVAGQNISTEITLVNVEEESGIFVEVEGFDDFGESVGFGSFELEPGSMYNVDVIDLLNLDVQSLSQFQFISGFLEFKASGVGLGGFPITPRVAGTIGFSTNNGKTFSILPLTNRALREQVLLQVAQNKDLFTGLTIFNPGANGPLGESITADVTIEAVNGAGDVVASRTVQIEPRRRFISLLDSARLFGPGFQQVKGHVRIVSSNPTIAFGLFGDRNQEYLAAVEPQSPTGN